MGERRIKGLPPRPDATSTEALHAAGAREGGRTHPISAWINQFRLRFVGHLARREDDYLPTCMLYAAGINGFDRRVGRAGRPRKDFADMIVASFSDVLGREREEVDSRLRAEVCDADTDFWIRLAGIRGWWRNELVNSARPFARPTAT